MEGEQETFAPVVKITDFGLAREKVTKVQEDLRESLAIARASMAGEAQQEKEKFTAMMTGCGTLYWMAPEILKGEVYNEKVDVYAFAMCLLEMVSGKVPWGTLPAAEVPVKVALEEKRPVSLSRWHSHLLLFARRLSSGAPCRISRWRLARVLMSACSRR